MCCLSVVIQAADENTDDGAINLERDDETAEDGDDPFRIKRQHGHGSVNPLSSILSSVFNKKLGFIGSLSSISSSSKGGGVEHHHHTYDYPVSFNFRFKKFNYFPTNRYEYVTIRRKFMQQPVRN